jgi:hypothetical protein
LLPSIAAQGLWTHNQFPAEFALGPGAPTIVIIPQNQSERELFSAEVNQIQARTELASSHVALQISSGLPLNVE